MEKVSTGYKEGGSKELSCLRGKTSSFPPACLGLNYPGRESKGFHSPDLAVAVMGYITALCTDRKLQLSAKERDRETLSHLGLLEGGLHPDFQLLRRLLQQ
jgi:hypothetical protein